MCNGVGEGALRAEEAEQNKVSLSKDISVSIRCDNADGFQRRDKSKNYRI